MIRLSNISEIPSGDHSQVDPINIGDKLLLFRDDVLGMGLFDMGVFTPFPVGSGIQLMVKSEADYQWDGVQWYLELPVQAVLSCEVNGNSIVGQLDKSYSPPRYTNSGFIDNTTPQTVIIYYI